MTWNETREVQPVDRRWNDQGKVYKYEYKFGEVHVQDVPRDYGPDKVSLVKAEDAIKWKYEGKPPIMIYNDRVVAKKEDDKETAEKQAYYALSMMASDGLVSRFRQK